MDGETEYPQEVTPALDTQHEPHEHAPRRVMVGVTAVIVVFVLGGIIWSRWGSQIEKICFGDDESCAVESAEEYVDGTLQYDASAFEEEVSPVAE